jgi:hypothetical protein
MCCTGLQDSFLDEGFILDKKIGVGQPHRITDAKVLIANTPMDTDKIKIYGARVRVDSMAKVGVGSSWWCCQDHACVVSRQAMPQYVVLCKVGIHSNANCGSVIRQCCLEQVGLLSGAVAAPEVSLSLLLLLQVADIEAAEKNKMKEKCEKIISHGINCFINRQLIYNYPEEIFADAGEIVQQASDCRSRGCALGLIVLGFFGVELAHSFETLMMCSTSVVGEVLLKCLWQLRPQTVEPSMAKLFYCRLPF